MRRHARPGALEWTRTINSVAFEIAPGCDRAFSMNFCAVSYIKHRSCSCSSSHLIHHIFATYSPSRPTSYSFCITHDFQEMDTLAHRPVKDRAPNPRPTRPQSAPAASHRPMPPGLLTKPGPLERNYRHLLAKRRPLSPRQLECQTLLISSPRTFAWDAKKLGELPLVHGASIVGVVTRPEPGPTGRWSAAGPYSGFGSHPLRQTVPKYTISPPDHRCSPRLPRRPR